MTAQDNKFNYKIILATLIAVIIGVLIAFYYSHAQSQNRIGFLENEKSLLVKDLTLMKADVDRLSALDEVNEIELQDFKEKVRQLSDSVGKLNFTVEKLKDFKKELRDLESKHDSLKVKNNFLKYNNMLLSDKYEATRNKIEDLRGKTSTLAEQEAIQRRTIQDLNKELKVKSYLVLIDEDSEGMAYRMRGGKPIRTNKASSISKLRGCVTIAGNPDEKTQEKVLYFQFLGPNKEVMANNANTVSVNGNIYSKRVELIYTGKTSQFCDIITVPEGSLEEGLYTLNIFEEQKLLSSTEFQLK